MLTTAKEMLADAQKREYAICAPNVSNFETAKAAIDTAEALRAPILLDFFYFGQYSLDELLLIFRAVENLARYARVPVVIQQDHGKTFVSSIQCIRAGFTSIMADRSELPYEENIAQVRELTRIAHACEVSVEAELGHVGLGKDYDMSEMSNLTDPEEAAQFCEETGIDALAVAVGTAHGAYRGEPHLDFERLAKIRKAVRVPLVLHGGSGTGDENLVRASKSGICKINIATDVFNAGVESVFSHEDKRSVFLNYIKGYKEKLAYYIKLFSQNDKANGWNAG